MINSYTKINEYNTDFELSLRSRDEKTIKETNKYGSEIERLLSQYGLEWKTNPYRIVFAKTEEAAQEGPSFDLRRPTLAKLQKNLSVSK